MKNAGLIVSEKGVPVVKEAQLKNEREKLGDTMALWRSGDRQAEPTHMKYWDITATILCFLTNNIVIWRQD